LHCNLLKLDEIDFNCSRQTLYTIDPKLVVKRLHRIPFAPKNDISTSDRFSQRYCKERANALSSYWQEISKLGVIFEFNDSNQSSCMLRRFLGVDYTIWLRKNDEWFARDTSRSLVNYDQHQDPDLALDLEMDEQDFSKDEEGESLSCSWLGCIDLCIHQQSDLCTDTSSS
jgi:hypothetical protein